MKSGFHKPVANFMVNRPWSWRRHEVFCPLLWKFSLLLGTIPMHLSLKIFLLVILQQVLTRKPHISLQGISLEQYMSLLENMQYNNL